MHKKDTAPVYSEARKYMDFVYILKNIVDELMSIFESSKDPNFNDIKVTKLVKINNSGDLLVYENLPKEYRYNIILIKLLVN